MSLLKAIKAQLGLSNTPANNFTLDASAGNGTMKLARGNAGATTQDILTVDASGNVLVDGNNLNLFSAKSLASSGYQKLPSGLIIQWGLSGAIAVGSSLAVTFPVAFPAACLTAMASPRTITNNTAAYSVGTFNPSTTQVTISNNSSNSGAVEARYIAIGY